MWTQDYLLNCWPDRTMLWGVSPSPRPHRCFQELVSRCPECRNYWFCCIQCIYKPCYFFDQLASVFSSNMVLRISLTFQELCSSFEASRKKRWDKNTIGRDQHHYSCKQGQGSQIRAYQLVGQEEKSSPKYSNSELSYTKAKEARSEPEEKGLNSSSHKLFTNQLVGHHWRLTADFIRVTMIKDDVQRDRHAQVQANIIQRNK